MKSLSEAPLTAPHESFSVKVKNQGLHDPFLHRHAMYELTFMPKVKALRFIGDSIKEIYEDELVLLAPNLPHCWHILATGAKEIPAFVIHFKEDFLGESFFEIPEMSDFRRILRLAERGIKFSAGQQERLLPAMKELEKLRGFKRLIQLLTILEMIGNFDSAEFRFMASAHYQVSSREDDYQSINLVFKYVHQNFTRRITLQEAAHLAHLSTSAFCRYFRKCTGRTFMDFVKEVRIGHACHLLHLKAMSISEIGYSCGYNNMANFNRQFRQITQHSPKEYQKLYQFDTLRHLSKQ